MNVTDTTGSETPVRRQYRRLATLSRPETGLTDEERATRCERISLAVTALVRLPSEILDDVVCKLTVVSERLRTDNHTLASPFGALTALLLESARDDLVRLAMLADDPGDKAAAP